VSYGGRSAEAAVPVLYRKTAVLSTETAVFLADILANRKKPALI